MTLSLSSVINRSGSVAAGEVGGEVVALDIQSGECFGLNRVASRIWELLTSPTTVGEVASVLTGEYDVEPETCERELLSLLDEFSAAGLITIGDPAEATPK